MKAVILAGGLGSRLSEETHLRPKPMVEIGGRPILWHIMKVYAAHGVTDFVVCLGYKGYVIKEYFANFFLHASDVTFDLSANTTTVHHAETEPWRVTLVDTGAETMTGGRLRRVRSYVDDGTFCFTYGDAVADIDVTALVASHQANGRRATVTTVQQPGRWGAVSLDGDLVTGFDEKPEPTGDVSRINGGFFVLEPDVIDYIGADETPWEAEPLERLAAEGQLSAYRHNGFWQAMDTLRDRNHLEHLWATGQADWKTW
ncbi:MAG: glucose-phosphate cytidylyltransferase [Acidimicrobiales bacterium]|nr:glucose-phosphate cytidylyltransferase [Acidimicrobiales bacterium]